MLTSVHNITMWCMHGWCAYHTHMIMTALNRPDGHTVAGKYLIYLTEHTPMLKRSGWHRVIQRSVKISCETASPYHGRGSAEGIPRLEKKSIKIRKMVILLKSNTSAQCYSHLPRLWICSSSFPRRHDARRRSSSPFPASWRMCMWCQCLWFLFDFTDLVYLRIIRSAPPLTIVHLY